MNKPNQQSKPSGQQSSGQQWHTGPEAGQKGANGQTDRGPDQGKPNSDSLREDDNIGPRERIKPHDKAK